MNTSAKNALIIEDDELLCEEVSETLRDEGYQVEVSSDGEEGNDRLSRRRYDVVVMDLDLSGPRGFDARAGLRTERKHLCIIVVSGGQVAAHRLDVGRPEDEGQDGAAARPIDRSTLLVAIRALGRRAFERIREAEGAIRLPLTERAVA